jgi:cholesterol 7-dehydrogenase
MGKVVGNCIECPFHGWQFEGESGNCAKIPYSDQKIPEAAKLRKYVGEEINQTIFVWFDPDGNPPMWTIQRIPQVSKLIPLSHYVQRSILKNLLSTVAPFTICPVIYK